VQYKRKRNLERTRLFLLGRVEYSTETSRETTTELGEILLGRFVLSLGLSRRENETSEIHSLVDENEGVELTASSNLTPSSVSTAAGAGVVVDSSTATGLTDSISA
jgi:hypothetical protein